MIFTKQGVAELPDAIGKFPGTVVYFLMGLLIVSFAIRIFSQFRGLVMPLFIKRPGEKLRMSLRIHSYLPRWGSASSFIGGWTIGVAALWLIINVSDHFLGHNLSELVDFLIIFIAGSIYIAVAYRYYGRVRRLEQVRIQRKRDDRAQAVLAQLSSTRKVAPAYSVWLRPFISTGRVSVVAKSRYVKLKHEDISKEGFHVEFGDFETLLAIVIEPFAPLIALGVGGEQIGAGRITAPENDWQNTFELLAKFAHSVFLLPSHRSGTQWELRWLLETPDVLRRCIFVLPPLPPPTSEIRASFVAPGAKYVPSRQLKQIALTRAREDELWQVRSEALQALAQVLQPEDHAKLEEARDGALFQLTDESGPHIVKYSELGVSEPWWAYWSGPRFSQSRLRSAVLDLASYRTHRSDG